MSTNIALDMQIPADATDDSPRLAGAPWLIDTLSTAEQVLIR